MSFIASPLRTSTPSFRLPRNDVRGSLHLLSVENGSLESELLCAALHHFRDHNITFVAGGRSALAKLETVHCNLLICDLCLRGTDGIAFLRRDAGILAAVALVERGVNVVALVAKPFTMDAIGMDYSSLALLLGLLSTDLKIDRSVSARLATLQKARTLLEMMIMLGNRLHMDVVAECVKRGSSPVAARPRLSGGSGIRHRLANVLR